MIHVNKLFNYLLTPFLYLAFYLIKAYRYVRDGKWTKGERGDCDEKTKSREAYGPN